MQIPSGVIDSAESIPAGSYTPPGSKESFDNLPAFCRVDATLTPLPDSEHKIELWLPAENWNRRYQQVGQHGWGRNIYWGEMDDQLRRGYAVGATNGGHPFDPNSPNSFFADWALGHPTKIEDFAWRAVHELAVNGKAIVTDYYGTPAQTAIYNGCSDGGRDGLRSAQDFPKDFDGILAGGAAINWTGSVAQQLIISLNMQKAGIGKDNGPAVLNLALRSEMAACDAADGVKDGILSDPVNCHYDPRSMVCKAGQEPGAEPTCFTQAEADALHQNMLPIVDPSSGRWIMSGAIPGTEPDQIRFHLMDGPAPFSIANYQIATNDPTWNASNFDLERDHPGVEREVGAIMNSLDPDLSAFKAAGGKMIEYHGWGDVPFTPGSITHYYENVIDTTGGGDVARVQDFYRLFMMPGVGHCNAADIGSGPVNIGAENQIPVSNDPQHDAVNALVRWVEQGDAPDKLIASTLNEANKPESGVSFERPVCPYPQKAVWDGKGDTKVASSFNCQ